MNEKFELRGIWYLPDNPDDQTDGTLVFDPDGHIILEIMGTLKGDPFSSSNTEDIILGFTTSGKKITLLNCSAAGRKIAMPGIPVIKYSASIIFEGEHFFNVNELKFYKLISEITKLEEWVNILGLDVQFTNTKELNVKYVIPDTVSFRINDHLRGAFRFSYNALLFPDPDYRIKQTTSLELIEEDEIDYRELTKHLYRFEMFITLGVFENVFVKKLQLLSRRVIDEKEKEIPINIYYRQRNKNLKIDKRESFDFLFNYSKIELNFESIIQKWFLLEDKLSPVLYILLESFSTGKVFTENSFLNIIQALEIYHRRVKENTEELKANFNEELEPVLSLLGEEQKVWVKEKLEYRYEPNLQTRLKDLLKEYKIAPLTKILNGKDERKSLVYKATNSRNYYTHYNLDLKEKACRGHELFILTQKLRVLLILVILRETGFTNDEIESLFESKSYRFFNHLFS